MPKHCHVVQMDSILPLVPIHAVQAPRARSNAAFPPQVLLGYRLTSSLAHPLDDFVCFRDLREPHLELGLAQFEVDSVLAAGRGIVRIIGGVDVILNRVFQNSFFRVALAPGVVLIYERPNPAAIPMFDCADDKPVAGKLAAQTRIRCLSRSVMSIGRSTMHTLLPPRPWLNIISGKIGLDGSSSGRSPS
jgi:hypothetical protein